MVIQETSAMERNRTVVVIGAGTAGLAAIKSCLEENLQAICYEQTKDIGGLWRFRPEVIEGQGSVMKGTIMNTSKEMSTFSDFPPPDHFPNFMHHTKMLEYLRLYAENFRLTEYIRFNHEVLSVIRSDNFARSGQWIIKVRNKNLDNKPVDEILADGVMVCNGHHGYPTSPVFPGLNTFRQQVLHSHAYRKQKHFDGQTVLVVGTGNSGVDIAVELSLICKQVYLSTRRGCWILHRLGPQGKPLDSYILRRFLQQLNDHLPFWFCCSILEKLINRRFNHQLYNLQPKHRILSQYPTTCDRLPSRILSGTVAIKGKISTFTEYGVVFEDEKDREYELDSVIMATGYDAKCPFLEEDLLSLPSDGEPEFYKNILPPHLEQPTLGFIGLVQPFGAYLPVVEMQCRWFVRVLCGKVSLPTKNQMMKKLTKTSGSKTVKEVMWIPYIDELARDIGVNPSLGEMVFRDPELFRQCLLGPCVPYQYRLRGPHIWKDAREAIMTTRDRVWNAFQTRKIVDTYKKMKRNPRKQFPKVIFGFMSILLMALLMSMVV